MPATQKLNLKAIKHDNSPHQEEKNSIVHAGEKKVEEVIIENNKDKIVEESAHKNTKMSLGMIKKDVNSSEKQTKQEVSIGEDVGENKNTSLSGSQEIAEKEGTKKNENNKEEKENATTKKNDDTVEFTNYESTFKKQSSHVLKRIQNFHYAPKTRSGLLIGLITIMVSIIGGLMLFFPNSHSVSIYKASLLGIYQNLGTSSSIQEVKGNIIVPIPIKDSKTFEEKKGDDISDIDTIEKGKIDILENKKKQKEKLKKYLLDRYSS